MRRMLCLVLILMLCLGALAEPAVAVPGNRLGLLALQRLADGSGNQFVSPLSLAYALSMAAAGAGGETLEELLAALDANDAADIAALGGALEAAGLRLANAAFVRDGVTLNPAYTEALRQGFGAELFPLNDPARVNAWAAEHTDGLIDRLLDEDADPVGMLMLINAIAMDADWACPFASEDTWTNTFHAPGGDVEVDFMHQKRFASYAETDFAQVIRLDYADSGLYMLVALPPEGGVPDLLAALAESGLDALALPETGVEVALSLPKLDAAVTNSLAETLQALGVGMAFSDFAQFGGISDMPMKVDDVIQKVRVQLDEEGTRAAAVTEVVLVDGAAPNAGPQPVYMNVNRPFVLLIADEDTGAVCFAGVVANPGA